ncbi:MAG: CDP-alcohol phosphatidyltransferase family protein [Actinomycetota bacterium]|nr:CDP-alcohol phosphatidyltransferase family protein [Actinomycetota bacterium]
MYSTHVNRPLGRRFAAAADVAGLSPNHVTLLSGLSSFTAIGLIALLPQTVPVGILVSAALVLGFALDSADGQLARLHRAGSPAGEWLDHLLDCAAKLALHSAVLVSWYSSGVRGPALLLPLGFQLVAVLLFFGGTLMAKLREQSGRARPSAQGSSRFSWLFLLPVDQGVLSCSFLLWGYPPAFQAVYAGLFAATAVLFVAFFVAWLRELS